MEDGRVYIQIISNILISANFVQQLKEIFNDLNLCCHVTIFQPEELVMGRSKFKSADLAVIFLNYESYVVEKQNKDTGNSETFIENMLTYFKTIYSEVKQNGRKSVLWFGMEDYGTPYINVFGNRYLNSMSLLDTLNDKMRKLLDIQDVFIDMKRLVAAVGIGEAYNIKGKYRWGMPYSEKLVNKIVFEIYTQYRIINCITAKCIILDCDNVLWGGVLSEDSINGIEVGRFGLGRPYRDFQCYLKCLKDHGVILAICSKNDEQDIREALQNHPEMVLRENDFDCILANWDKKVINLKKIIEYLNIQEKHIVFVDDTIFETEAARKTFPQMTVIQFRYSSIYKEIACFYLPDMVDECNVAVRHSSYQSELKRKDLLKLCDNYEQYLTELNSLIDIHEALPTEYLRISELTMRTNKMTNGKRYNFSELIGRLMETDYKLFAVKVSDRFSDLGIVGTIGIKGTKLDLFSMSCRAIGRGLEKEMCNFAKSMGVNEYEYISTMKNQDIKELFCCTI